jgi:hypothetical protein
MVWATGNVPLPEASSVARNSSGTHSLPAGNPVVSGTTISSTVHNTNDISSEITDSLSRSGKGPMLAALELADGTVAAPGLSFDTDTDCGLYRIGANNLGVAVNGAKVVDVATTGVGVTNGLTVTQSQSNTAGATVTGNGTASGVVGTGGTTGAGGTFANGTAANGGTRRNALVLTNGDLSMSGVTYPTSTTGASNLLTPANIPKAWASIALTNATPFVPSVSGGFNVASVARVDSQTLRVTFASAMANTNYAVFAHLVGGSVGFLSALLLGTGTVEFQFQNAAGSTITLDSASGPVVYFLVFGAQ